MVTVVGPICELATHHASSGTLFLPCQGQAAKTVCVNDMLREGACIVLETPKYLVSMKESDKARFSAGMRRVAKTLGWKRQAKAEAALAAKQPFGEKKEAKNVKSGRMEEGAAMESVQVYSWSGKKEKP